MNEDRGNEDRGSETGSHGTLSWAIRTAGIAGFAGLVAIHYFARAGHESPEPTRVAQAGTGRAAADPETTGSIARGARSVRFDPCGTPAGSRAPRS